MPTLQRATQDLWQHMLCIPVPRGAVGRHLVGRPARRPPVQMCLKPVLQLYRLYRRIIQVIQLTMRYIIEHHQYRIMQMAVRGQQAQQIAIHNILPQPAVAAVPVVHWRPIILHRQPDIRSVNGAPVPTVVMNIPPVQVILSRIHHGPPAAVQPCMQNTAQIRTL